MRGMWYTFSMNREEIMLKRRKRIELEQRKARLRKRQLALFFSVFLCVSVGGGAILGAVYAWKVYSEHNDTNVIAAENEESVVEPIEVFPSKDADKSFNEEQDELFNTRYGDVLNNQELMMAENIFSKSASNPDEITITFAGDIMFDDSYSIMYRYNHNGGKIEECISPNLIEEMHDADIFMLNNECTFTTRGTPTEGKKYTFRGKPEHVKILDEIGVDIVSLANNHAYDYGEISLLDTMDTLKEQSIPYVGAGRNIEEASKPVYMIINDMKIAFLAATQIERTDYPDTKGAAESTPGVFRCKDPAALCEAIQKAKENSDFVILYIHWGTENETSIDWGQRDQTPLYYEAGADVIIGDHPHILQPISFYQDMPVVYSLGNFWFNSKTMDNCLVKLTLNGEGLDKIQFIPCRQSDCKTVLLEGEEKEQAIIKMRELSSEILIDEQGFITKKD